MQSKKSVVIFILGVMVALTPFTIDMYLPAFPAIAADFGTTVARVSLSLSSYFIGLSLGQIMYGPLLDRFGRKPPLYVGLAIYITAAIFCVLSRTTENLVIWRFIQAVGGCAVGVGSMAMVRDLFTLKESAKVYSLLILILGASPLLAPTIGGVLASTLGWQSIFILLTVYAAILMLAIRFLLPETSPADATFSLKIPAIGRTYLSIIKRQDFWVFAVTGAVAFSGLFVYLAGSPVIFMEQFKVSAQTYGFIFGVVAAGMILASQINVQLLKRYSNQQVLFGSLVAKVLIGWFLFTGIWLGLLGLWGIVATLFCFFFCFGLSNPNAGALAMLPFSKNAGSAASMLGFLQMSLGAVASMLVGIFAISEILPIIGIMAGTASVALVIYSLGSRNLVLPEAHVN